MPDYFSDIFKALLIFKLGDYLRDVLDLSFLSILFHNLLDINNLLMAIEHGEHYEIDITLGIHTKVYIFSQIFYPPLFVLFVRNTVFYSKLDLLRLIYPPFILYLYSY